MTSTVTLEKMLEEYRTSIDSSIKHNQNGNNQNGSNQNGNAQTGRDPSDTTAVGGPPPLLQMDIRSVDDSRYPNEVELRAFVYDSSGRFVMGLAPPYFKGPGQWRTRWPRLIDSCNGKAVTIENFNVTEVREDKREPYAIGFVLDHSGSMGNRTILRLRSAVARVLSVIKRGDKITTVKFGSESEIDVPLTDDPKIFRNDFVVENISPPGGGGTALYDAAIVGIGEVARAPAGYKRAIILFTDGFDGNSSAKIDSLHRYARANHVAVYTVAYGNADVNVMRDIAIYTGGRMYRIYSYKEFPYVFADIYRGLNNYYRITYRPPDCSGIHTARVDVSLPELGFDPLRAAGSYDRSLFTPFDPVGTITLVNVEFDYDKATIRPESMSKVREIGSVMLTYPTMKMEVRGHTDDRGSDEYNQKLSEDRAAAVADVLVSMGIARDRLTVKGFGKTQPLVPNDSDENRKRNRRTEFVIVSK
jgi:Mg-chelatase subunit ChlD